MILYCIRHGESVYNAEGRIQGQADVPLSDLGLRQGRAVAAALREVPIDAIYASPLKRAWQTAELLSESLGFEIRADDRLKEVNVGIFQGKLRSEVGELHPDELARWTSGEPEYAIPGGESRADLKRRGIEVLRAIASRDHRHAAVVTHGRLLITSLKALLGMDHNAEPNSLENGSITRIELNGDDHPMLLAIDEVEHLAGVGLAGRGDL